MKIVWIYSSLSGNTKRLAQGLKARYTGPSEIYDIKEYPGDSGDLYVLCSWIDKGKPDVKSIDLASQMKGKEVYAIATLGAQPDSAHGQHCKASMGEIYGESQLLGLDLVQGSVSQAMIDKFKDLPLDHPHALTQERLARYKAIEASPTEAEIDQAYEKLMKVLVDKKSI